MTILKTETKRRDQHLLGVNVGQKTFNYLTLYCVANGTLKARIFSTLVLNWVSGQKMRYPESMLVGTITERIQKQRNKHPDRDMEDFLENARIELIKKNIPDDYIDLILRGVR